MEIKPFKVGDTVYVADGDGGVLEEIVEGEHHFVDMLGRSCQFFSTDGSRQIGFAVHRPSDYVFATREEAGKQYA